MTDTMVEIALHASLFAAVFFIAFSTLQQMENTASSLKKAKGGGGQATLAEIYLNFTQTQYLFVRAVCGLIFFALGFLIGDVVLGLIGGLVGYVLPILYLKRLRRKWVQRVEQQLVEALELMGNSLKSGLTLQQACELLVREFPPPISAEFSTLLAETRVGVDFTDALQNMAARLDSNIVYILASGVSITKKCGGDLTQIFTNIATTIREQATIEGKLNAVTAQGRFQGLVLGLLPFVLVIILSFINPSHVSILFGYQLGIWAFAAVVLMVGIAQLWIRKLLDIDV